MWVILCMHKLYFFFLFLTTLNYNATRTCYLLKTLFTYCSRQIEYKRRNCYGSRGKTYIFIFDFFMIFVQQKVVHYCWFLNVPTIKKMQRENLWKSFIFKNAIPMTGSYLEQEAQKQALRYFYETTCNEWSLFFSFQWNRRVPAYKFIRKVTPS